MSQGQAAEWPLCMMAATMGVSSDALLRWQCRRLEAKAVCRRGRPSVIGAEARLAIRECYLEHFCQWGPQVLASWCRRESLGQWSHGTIASVIEDLRPQEEEKPPPVRYEATASNVLWSEDGTGFKQEGLKQELLVVQDDHARLKVNSRLVRGPAYGRDVAGCLRQAFERYGAPLVLKQDLEGINHAPEVKTLLEKYGVLSLASPPGTPRYNGKQERSMRDIKSMERAMRRAGPRSTLKCRIRVIMHDLNEDRPRPVLKGRTARETYEEGHHPLPNRSELRRKVERRERKILTEATSRADIRNARRWAIEETLVSYGLVKIEGEVSHDFL